MSSATAVAAFGPLLLADAITTHAWMGTPDGRSNCGGAEEEEEEEEDDILIGSAHYNLEQLATTCYILLLEAKMCTGAPRAVDYNFPYCKYSY